MATMSVTNPDIKDFITCKDLAREKEEGDISTFNISVLVTDAFMRESKRVGGGGVLRDIADHAWQTGEPGLIFIDRINQHNPMRALMGGYQGDQPLRHGRHLGSHAAWPAQGERARRQTLLRGG